MTAEPANFAGKVRLNTVTVKGSRFYELPNGDQVPSVTTFMKVLDKPALNNWRVKKVAEWAVKNLDSWRNLPEEAAIDVLSKSSFYDSAPREVGDISHKIKEDLSIGRDPYVPPGFEWAVRNWETFTSDFDVELLYAEPQLINYSYAYAGSADAILRIKPKNSGEWRTAIIDYKSGNGLYGSTAYQTTAYGMCEVILLPDGTEIDMPKIDTAYGFWTRPSGYALYPLTFDQNTWDVVRACRRLYDLTKRDWEYRGKPINPNPIKSAGPAAKLMVEKGSKAA